MRAHGHLGDEETGGDLGGREPFGEKLEDLPLALAKLDAGALCEQHLSATAALAELLDQLRDQGAGERRLPCEDSAQVGRELAPVDVLQQIAGSTRAEGVEEVGVVARDGEHDDRGLGQPLRDGPRCSDPAARHVDVEQANRRVLFERELNRCIRGGSLAANLEAVLLEDRANPGPGRGVVVRDHDPDPLAHGSRTSMRVPSPSSEQRLKRPPSASARSRMLTRPKPPTRVWRGSKPEPSSAMRRKVPCPFVSSTETFSAPPWRPALVIASRTMRMSASRSSGETDAPAQTSMLSWTPTRPATSSAACTRATSSGSSTGLVSAAIARLDSSSARSAAAARAPLDSATM